MAKECVLSTGNLPLGGLPRSSVDRITDRPDMSSAFDCGRKELTQPTKQPTNNIHVVTCVPYFHVIQCKVFDIISKDAS